MWLLRCSFSFLNYRLPTLDTRLLAMDCCLLPEKQLRRKKHMSLYLVDNENRNEDQEYWESREVNRCSLSSLKRETNRYLKLSQKKQKLGKLHCEAQLETNTHRLGHSFSADQVFKQLLERGQMNYYQSLLANNKSRQGNFGLRWSIDCGFFWYKARTKKPIFDFWNSQKKSAHIQCFYHSRELYYSLTRRSFFSNLNKPLFVAKLLLLLLLKLLLLIPSPLLLHSPQV